MSEGERFLETSMVIGMWAGALFGGYEGLKNAWNAETPYDAVWKSIARYGFYSFAGVACGVFLGLLMPLWMILICFGMVIGAVALAIFGATRAWRYCVDRKRSPA